MKPSSQPPRAPSSLSESLQRHLNAYALAASAAGVSVLALAPPSEARVIYTRAHAHIGPHDTLRLDLNHDGIADFDLKDSTSGVHDRLLVVPDHKRNTARGHFAFAQGYASALSAGLHVGPRGQFLPASGMMAQSSSSTDGRAAPFSCTGPWANVSNRYLGLKFVIKGEPHFAWARLNVECNGNAEVQATLTGYAYETIANKPILTGEKHGADKPTVDAPSLPHGLRHLAQGATGRPDK